MCPRLQTPQPGRGCSPHGLVEIRSSKYHELLYSFIRSRKTTPGSAEIHADSMIVSHISRARMVLIHLDRLFVLVPPALEVAVPKPVVVGVGGVGEDQLPLAVFFDRLHKGVADPDGDVGVGDGAHVPLGLDKVENVGVPVVEDQHEGAPAAAALLHQAGGKGEEAAPAHRARAAAVDAFDVGQAGPQRREVDADAAASGHDLDHVAQRVDDRLAGVPADVGVVGLHGDHVAVVGGEILACAQHGVDAPAGAKAEVVQRPAKLFFQSFALGRCPRPRRWLWPCGPTSGKDASRGAYRSSCALD